MVAPSGAARRPAKKRLAARQLTPWEGNPRDADTKKDRAAVDELARVFLDDYRINNRKSIDQAEDHVGRLLKTWGGRRAVSITVTENRDFAKSMQAEKYASPRVCWRRISGWRLRPGRSRRRPVRRSRGCFIGRGGT